MLDKLYKSLLGWSGDNAWIAEVFVVFVYTFTRTTVWTRYHETKQDVLLKISDIVAAHGAGIAYPTSTLHMPELAQVSVNAAHPG
ncbi:MAG: hypothetical protein WBN57_07730 [Gammaproteobacteria bacterium]